MKLHVVIITIKENPALSCLHDCNVEQKTRADNSSHLEPKAWLCLHIIAWIISHFSSDSANSLAPGRITARLTRWPGTSLLRERQCWALWGLRWPRYDGVVSVCLETNTDLWWDFFFSVSLDSRWIDCFSSSGCHPFHASGVCSDVRD